MKFRALLVAMMAGGMLVGCALQEVGAPIYSRTGSTGVATSGTFATTGDTYTVQPGDTLYSIATRKEDDQQTAVGRFASWYAKRATEEIDRRREEGFRILGVNPDSL